MAIEIGEMALWAGRVDAWAARQVLSGKAVPTADALRDMADSASGGDLDCVQLDILCEMIDRRIGRWLKGAN